MIKKVSDAPRGGLMVSRLEAVKLISDRFDLHSISLRGKFGYRAGSIWRESLDVQTSL
jgi:hypothetical protein